MPAYNPAAYNPGLFDLEGDPEALFQSYLPKNLSQRQQRFGTGLFNRFSDLFRGEVGRDVRAGGAGELLFSDFLNQNFNFNKEQAFGDPIATGRARFQAPARFLLRR
jgi:hypothetical protein